MWSLWLCGFHHLRQSFFMDFGKMTIMVLLFSPVTSYCFSTWTSCKDYCSYFPLKVPIKARWLLREFSQFQSSLVLTPCSRRVRYETNSVQGRSGSSSWGAGRSVVLSWLINLNYHLNHERSSTFELCFFVNALIFFLFIPSTLLPRLNLFVLVAR